MGVGPKCSLPFVVPVLGTSVSEWFKITFAGKRNFDPILIVLNFIEQDVQQMVNIETYKSILQKLSALPTDYLELVDNYLAALSEKINKKEENRNAIMALAGSWSDMDDDEFEDFLRVTKETGDELFNREVDL